MTQHTRFVRMVRETSDWTLIRECQCPVLLVKTGRPYGIDKVLVAVGRKPNGKLINAEAAGVAVDERGFIAVDEMMRTGEPGVYAWDLPEAFNPATVDVTRYSELLIRAAHTILQPLGVSEQQTQTWLLNQAVQMRLRI